MKKLMMFGLVFLLVTTAFAGIISISDKNSALAQFLSLKEDREEIIEQATFNYSIEKDYCTFDYDTEESYCVVCIKYNFAELNDCREVPIAYSEKYDGIVMQERCVNRAKCLKYDEKMLDKDKTILIGSYLKKELKNLLPKGNVRYDKEVLMEPKIPNK